MVYQPFFYVHVFNLIDIKVIRARGSCVVIAVYLVFTNLECEFEAELVASQAANFSNPRPLP